MLHAVVGGGSMFRSRKASVLALFAMLSSCGGGSGGGGTTTASNPGGTATTPTPTPTPPAVPAACSLASRQAWAKSTLDEWYLFPETLPATLDPTPYTTVDDYIDALTATARSQRRDRFFTYLTSIKEEDAFYSAGSSAGFGFRLAVDQTGTRIFLIEAFEGAPALGAGIDRGDEIVAIGTTSGNLRTISAIVAAEGLQGVSDALGPDTAGTARVFQVRGAAGTRMVSIAKADYELTPVSARYGARVITDGGRQVGYLNLRTFISTADPALRTAFADFRAQGITNFVIDLRYNGGGLLSTAELMGDLLGGNRTTSDVFSYTTFRPEKASFNETRFFQPTAQSVSPVKIAFIGTGSTASASELVINAFIPYLGANVGLIGTNTYGKPVGQVAIDRPECDDRLRVIALSLRNAANNGNYFDGLAASVQASCRADDDISHPLGDPQETSIRQALNYLSGIGCTTIASGGQNSLSLASGPKRLVTGDRPNTLQREVPGTF